MEREIYDRIFSHLNEEKDFGYPFQTDEELVAETDALEVPCLFDDIERRASKMPKAYGAAFRYIVHRDLEARLRRYEQLASRRVRPRNVNPRHVAQHA